MAGASGSSKRNTGGKSAATAQTRLQTIESPASIATLFRIGARVATDPQLLTAIRENDDAESTAARGETRPPEPMTIRRAAGIIHHIDKPLASLLFQTLDGLYLQISLDDPHDYEVWLSAASHGFEPFVKETAAAAVPKVVKPQAAAAAPFTFKFTSARKPK